jgi:hypothetical protein
MNSCLGGPRRLTSWPQLHNCMVRRHLHHTKRYVGDWRFPRQYVSECYTRDSVWQNSIYTGFRTLSTQTRWQNRSPCHINFCKCCDRIRNKIWEILSLVAGEGSWFFLEIFMTYGWSGSRDDLPSRLKQNIQTEKYLISIIWSPSDIHNLLPVLKGEHCNSTFFVNVIVPDLQTNFYSGTQQKILKCWTVHRDNT